MKQWAARKQKYQFPLPVLGLLYPLAVFLKHGKLNMELITSEGIPTAVDEDE